MLNNFTKSRLIEFTDYPVSELSEEQQKFVGLHRDEGYFVRANEGDYFVTSFVSSKYANANKVELECNITPLFNSAKLTASGLDFPVCLIISGHRATSISPKHYSSLLLTFSLAELEDTGNECFKKFVKVDSFFKKFMWQNGDNFVSKRNKFISKWHEQHNFKEKAHTIKGFITVPKLIEIHDYPLSALSTEAQENINKYGKNGYFIRKGKEDFFVSSAPFGDYHQDFFGGHSVCLYSINALEPKTAGAPLDFADSVNLRVRYGIKPCGRVSYQEAEIVENACTGSYSENPSVKKVGDYAYFNFIHPDSYHLSIAKKNASRSHLKTLFGVKQLEKLYFSQRGGH